MREPDYPAHPALDRAILLPADQPRDAAGPAEAEAAWAASLGAPFLLLRGAALARQLLLEAAGVPRGAAVALPANATDPLVAAVKDHGAVPLFVGLGDGRDAGTGAGEAEEVALAWTQPVAGATDPAGAVGVPLLTDHTETAPVPVGAHRGASRALATLWGLHLSPLPEEAGALLTFAATPGGAALRAAVAARLRPQDGPDPAAALAQCRRLEGLAGRQLRAVDEVRRGLREAAGLPLLPPSRGGALPGGVVVVAPPACDATTFYAYVAREQTPVRWLPLLRPVHHAALRGAGRHAPMAAAAELARRLLIPVGPDDTAEEITHAVLGVVKAAEYLGVRWYAEPARAAAYAALLEERHGPDHDAFRPAFPIPTTGPDPAAARS